MRVLLSLLAMLVMTTGARADDSSDAEALLANFLTQVSQIADIGISDEAGLQASTTAILEHLRTEAERRDILWAASLGLDLDASQLTRTDAEGRPLPLDPDTLDDTDRRPAPDDQCDPPLPHPVSAGSTVDANWQRCGIFETDDGWHYFIDFAELLYGVDGNYRRVRLAIVVNSQDVAYVEDMAEPASAYLSTLISLIDAQALTD